MWVNVTNIAPGFNFSAMRLILCISESSKHVEFANMTSPSDQLNSNIEPWVENENYRYENGNKKIDK